MELSQETQKRIDNYSLHNQQNKIFNYLKKELENGTASAQAILNYARDYYWYDEPGTPYVIDAEIINYLGVTIEELEDDEQKKFAPQFYLLAAERQSSWGNSNYARCLLSGLYGLPQSPPEALKYARAAQNNPSQKHEHKFILCKALRVNQLFKEANSALVDFLNYKFMQVKAEKNKARQKILEGKFQEALTSCKTIINEFETDFTEANKSKLTAEYYQNKLAELKPILAFEVKHDEFSELKRKALFLKGQYYEKLNKPKKAWPVYCSITNETLPFYKEVIAARVRLLKMQVNTLIEESTLLSLRFLNINDNSGEDDLNIREQNPSFLILPNEISLPANFISASWTKEAAWFDAFNRIEYEKYLKQSEKFITIKKEEISLIDEFLKDLANNDVLLAKKQLINEELKKLQSLKNELNEKCSAYLPEKRKIYRRKATETHFFNPSRSKKIKDIVELTEKIIDHRFRTDEKATLIDLTGKSTRLLITAERVFQEAVLALSGESSPKLGIPSAGGNPWNCNGFSGTNEYGPKECYQVGSTSMKSKHRANPKKQRLGDSYLSDLGKYSGNIFIFLSKITINKKEKEQQVAKFLIRYGRKHQPITLEELQATYNQANEYDVHHFNRICFLVMEKEQAQWHCATDERYQLGMTVAQARCLILIEAGYISFAEAFKNDVPFGVYSQTEIINYPSKVTNACERIDALYMAYLQTKHAPDYLKFFKQHITEKTLPTCVLTREQAHADLKYVYGGESDTDNEGYDTDVDLSM